MKGAGIHRLLGRCGTYLSVAVVLFTLLFIVGLMTAHSIGGIR